jgi:Zn-dependent protease
LGLNEEIKAILVFGSLLLASVVFHELSHGFAANALGDPTAKRAGRLTLNPFKHIDPFWTVLLPLILFFTTQGRFVFGMAKPVPVNFGLLRNPKAGMIAVAAAGPAANLALAALTGFVWQRTGNDLLLAAAYLNIGLALFNLFPVPPLDGSRIVAGFLSWRMQGRYFKLEKIGYAIILGLYFTGILMRILKPAINFTAVLFGLPNLEGVL